MRARFESRIKLIKLKFVACGPAPNGHSQAALILLQIRFN